LALATNYCFLKEGIVLNPHYKNMGLYGSELHTATAASKFGNTVLNYMKDSAKPLIVSEALSLNIADVLPKNGGNFYDNVLGFASELAQDKKKLKI
jgi:putative two-component system hydrogenase maturation factor HypX/HoxX